MSSSEVKAAKALQAAIEARRQAVVTGGDCKKQLSARDNKCDYTGAPILRRIVCALVMVFTCHFTGMAQVPEVWPEELKATYLEHLDSNCTKLYDFRDSLIPENYILNEEWTAVGTDTFPGFWVNQTFFVPEKGIYLQFLDCGVTFDYLPQLRLIEPNSEPILYNSKWDKFMHTKNQSVATWTRIIGYSLMGLGGYLGSEGERQRVVNGLDSPGFHLNRDLSLACAFSAGASFTLSWGKTPNLKWYEPVLDATLGALTWYAVAQKNWESYK